MAKAVKKNIEEPSVARVPTQAGRESSANGIRILVPAPATRISLRAPAASVAALSKALGLTLPQAPKSSAAKGDRTALWLGPDEWLVIDEAGGSLVADCSGVTALHAAVDISHRNVAIEITGPNVAATLNAGCPQDLSLAAFPVGACSRTILGKIEIVLYRVEETRFRVECWRSFSDYALAFLSQAAFDAAT